PCLPPAYRPVQRRVRRGRVDAPLGQAILSLELGPLRIQHLKKIRDPLTESQARQLGRALARGTRLLEPFHLEPGRAIPGEARLDVLRRGEDGPTVLRAGGVLPCLRRVHLRLHPSQGEARSARAPGLRRSVTGPPASRCGIAPPPPGPPERESRPAWS